MLLIIDCRLGRGSKSPLSSRFAEFVAAANIKRFAHRPTYRKRTRNIDGHGPSVYADCIV